ncbi:MAG: GNAT family N-acetyltransferase [Candidatus Paceibacterota bacterium]|jgi:ribosomal-protein-alanine N-acetyltransferase
MNDTRSDKTGAEILIRPICPDDEERLLRFYLNLGDRTFYSYHGRSRNRNAVITEEKILKQCHPSKEDLCLVAVHDNEIVGQGALLRMERFQEADYEMAHLIADAYQRRGIGSLLAKALLAHAGEHWAKKRIVAYTHIVNIGARKLLQKFGFIFENTECGEMTWIYTVP